MERWRQRLPLKEVGSSRAPSCHGHSPMSYRHSERIAQLAGSGPERGNACGTEGRPSIAGRTATKQEPGIAHAGKTGTATGQPVAVDEMATPGDSPATVA